jgi:hypothetical protein
MESLFVDREAVLRREPSSGLILLESVLIGSQWLTPATGNFRDQINLPSPKVSRPVLKHVSCWLNPRSTGVYLMVSPTMMVERVMGTINVLFAITVEG